MVIGNGHYTYYSKSNLLLHHESLNQCTHFHDVTHPQKAMTPYCPPHQTQIPSPGIPLLVPQQSLKDNLFPYINLSSDHIRGTVSLSLSSHCLLHCYSNSFSLFPFLYLRCCHFLKCLLPLECSCWFKYLSGICHGPGPMLGASI